MNYQQKIIGEIEKHSVEGIKECFAHGVDPNDHFNNEPLIIDYVPANIPNRYLKH